METSPDERAFVLINTRLELTKTVYLLLPTKKAERKFGEQILRL